MGTKGGGDESEVRHEFSYLYRVHVSIHLVQPPRPQQCRVDHVRAVRGSHKEDALAALNAVHLGEQLVDDPASVGRPEIGGWLRWKSNQNGGRGNRCTSKMYN